MGDTSPFLEKSRVEVSRNPGSKTHTHDMDTGHPENLTPRSPPKMRLRRDNYNPRIWADILEIQ